MNPLTTAPTDDTGVPPVPPEGSPKSSGEGQTAGRLSDLHRDHHKGALQIARQCRQSGLGAEWARMMNCARISRFYFSTLRGIGE